MGEKQKPPRACCASHLFPSRKLADGTRACCFCGNPCQGRRIRYCSNKCEDEVLVRCNAGIARQRVEWRDKGVCANCGLDTRRLEHEMEELKRAGNGWIQEGFIWRKQKEELDRKQKQAKALLGLLITFMRELGFDVRGGGVYEGFWRGALWQADHIVPVTKGGGACGLEGLRTLCTPCHKAETAKLAAQLASERRAKKPLTLFDAEQTKGVQLVFRFHVLGDL